MPLPLSEMEDGRSVKFLPYHILLFVARLLLVDDVGLSVAGCIEILIDRARHFFQISAIESVLLINRNSLHISNLVAVIANNSCHQARPRSPPFRLRHLTIIKQQQRRENIIRRCGSPSQVHRGSWDIRRSGGTLSRST